MGQETNFGEVAILQTQNRQTISSNKNHHWHLYRGLEKTVLQKHHLYN